MIKNILILVNGTAISQVILLVAIPVLSRLYTPSDFGVYGIFVAFLAILLPFSTLKYSTAILIKTENHLASSVLILCLAIAIGTSLLVFLIGLGGSSYLPKTISVWLIGVFTFLFFTSGIGETLVNWHVFHSRFTVVAIGSAIQSVMIVGCQIFFAPIYGSDGLIYGYAFGVCSMLIFYLFLFGLKDHAAINYKEAASGVKSAAIYHKEFPKFSIWANLLNSLSNQLPTIFLGKFFSTTVTGNFEMSRRLTRAPLALIGQSIFVVVSQRIGGLADNRLEAGEILKTVTTYMANLAIIPFVIGVLFLDDLLLIVLGEQWVDAGFYAQILSPWMFMLYLSWPLTSAYNTFCFQRYLLVFNFVFAMCIVVAFLMHFLFDISSTYVLIIMTGLSTLARVLYCFWILRKCDVSGLRSRLFQITSYCGAISISAFVGAKLI